MKAHYQVRTHNHLIYFFTTTTRSMENCLNLIQERFSEYPEYKVFMNGDNIFEKKQDFLEERSVIDRLTGKQYVSIYAFHKDTKVNYSTARHWVCRRNKRLHYCG